MVLGKLPSLIAALPVSTGIETLSKKRMVNLREESSPLVRVGQFRCEGDEASGLFLAGKRFSRTYESPRLRSTGISVVVSVAIWMGSPADA
jgi:hypothetical protein